MNRTDAQPGRSYLATVSRRWLLLAAGLLPAARLLAGPAFAEAPAAPEGIVIRDGWILRTGDLHLLPSA